MTARKQTTAAEEKKALGAIQKKTFVIPRTGQIVESPPEPDWANRLRAAELGTKVLKLHDEGQQQVIVNIVRYAPIDAPLWPGSEDNTVNTESIPYDGRKED